MRFFLIIFLCISCQSMANQIVSFYLDDSWKQVDSESLNSKFNVYLNDPNYTSVNVYENKSVNTYVLVRDTVYLNFEHESVCSSNTEMRFFSKDNIDLNISSIFLGKNFVINRKGIACKDITKNGSVFSIGYLSDKDFYGIFNDFSQVKTQIKRLNKQCDIDKIIFFERKIDGSINGFSVNSKTENKFSIIFKEINNKITPEDCFQILD